MSIHYWKVFVFVSLFFISSGAGWVSAADESPDAAWIEGNLLIAWGTPFTPVDKAVPMAVILWRDDGSRVHLELDGHLLAAAGGPVKASGRRVRVLIPAHEAGSDDASVRPLAIKEADGGSASPEIASGSYPYVSIMCRFQGNMSNLASLSYFQGMYANFWPGLDHYWRRQSYNMVKILIPGSTRFYTIEVRDRVGYDGNLPGFAVILHEVDFSRQEPAWLVDPSHSSSGSDPAAMWVPGECFEDAPNQISICVTSVTTEGYRVQVSYGDVGLIFQDGFESGNEGGWNASVQ